MGNGKSNQHKCIAKSSWYRNGLALSSALTCRIFLSSNICAVGQTKLMGLVRELNSGNKPMVGVEIYSKGANTVTLMLASEK